MRYTLSIHTQTFGKRGKHLDKMARTIAGLGKQFMFRLDMELPIELAGTVVGPRHGDQKIILEGSGVTKEFERNNTTGLSVQCSSRSENTPVQAIILSFRDHDDELTDRGTVWVTPGKPASAHLIIRGGTKIETVREIIDAAKRTVEERVLSHFLTTV